MRPALFNKKLITLLSFLFITTLIFSQKSIYIGLEAGIKKSYLEFNDGISKDTSHIRKEKQYGVILGYHFKQAPLILETGFYQHGFQLLIFHPRNGKNYTGLVKAYEIPLYLKFDFLPKKYKLKVLPYIGGSFLFNMYRTHLETQSQHNEEDNIVFDYQLGEINGEPSWIESSDFRREAFLLKSGITIEYYFHKKWSVHLDAHFSLGVQNISRERYYYEWHGYRFSNSAYFKGDYKAMNFGIKYHL